MDKIVLKMNNNPPIKTYNHHGFGTGIITSNGSMDWMYNNYIQLSYYPEEGPLTFDFYMNYIYYQPIFDVEHYAEDTMRLIKWNPLKFFRTAIKFNKYVECCVDEFYIPRREAYMRYHFIHNILIYGFDDVMKAFNTIGYDDNGKFSEQMVSYKQLLRAKPSKIHLLKYREEVNDELAVDYIAHQCKQYNGDICIEPVGAYPAKGRMIGVKAVNSVMDYIYNAVVHNEEVDIRPISILLEHRKLMLERLDKLSELNYVSKDNVIIFSKEVDKCEKLRNRVLLYNVRQSETDANALMELQEINRNVRIPEILNQ